MKILFTTHPAAGHLHPMVPVARALVQAGHEVVFATSRRFVERVRALGFRAIEAGFDWLESEGPVTFPEMATLDFPDINRFFMQQLFTDRLARPMVDDLLRFIRSEAPALVVRETWEFAGAIAAERAGIPHAVISAGLNFDIWRHMVIETVSALRCDYDLPPDPELRFLERHLVLDHVPTSLQYPQLAQPATRQAVGKVFFDSDSAAHDAALRTLDAPLVYVTAGTVFNRMPGYFRTIVEALAEEQVRVIVTTGMSGADAADIGVPKLPSNVSLARYIPQSQLLQRSALMISHGGFNTVLGAVNHGVPLITIPIAADQGQNGLRTAATGCGVCLPFHDRVATFPLCQDLAEAPLFSVDSLRDATRLVLRDQSFAIKSHALQLEALAMPGPMAAVRAMERLVRGETLLPNDRNVTPPTVSV